MSFILLIQFNSMALVLCVKEEPHWDQFGELQEVDPKIFGAAAAAAASGLATYNAALRISKNGSSNNKSEPGTLQQAAVPIPAVDRNAAALALFAPELQTAKLADVVASAAPKVKRELVIVHTDDTAALVDDSQEVLSASLIAGRLFAR
jgi:hypothetical protein